MTIIEELKEIIGEKNVFIYGYGTMGGTAHFTLHRQGYDIVGIVDSDTKKQGLSVGGSPIISPYDLMYYDKDNVMVFVCSDRAKEEVVNILESMNFSRDLNFSTFFLDGRSAPLTEFNPQIGWCRGNDQFIECDDSLNTDKIVLTLGGSTTDYSLNGFVSWPQLLNDKMHENVAVCVGGGYRVINGGVAGYCSSHELLSFITYGLKTIPNVLISYSGYNDAAGVLLYEYNDYHTVKTYDELIKIAKNNDAGDLLLMNFGSKINNYAMLWLKNARIMHGICEEFGIKHIHILQPSFITSGLLDEVEKEICTIGPYKDIYSKVNNFYNEIKEKMEYYEWIIDFTDIFMDNSVYIDTCHVNQAGNEVIASHIYRLLEEQNMLREVSK